MPRTPQESPHAEKRITVRFPAPLVAKLERMADRNYSTVTEELRRLVIEFPEQEREAA